MHSSTPCIGLEAQQASSTSGSARWRAGSQPGWAGLKLSASGDRKGPSLTCGGGAGLTMAQPAGALQWVLAIVCFSTRQVVGPRR